MCEKNKNNSSNSVNNGGVTDYYQLKDATFKINDADDFAEFRKMNWAQGSILKITWTFNIGRHDGTTYERDLNKIIHYANRELQRIKRENYETSNNVIGNYSGICR